MSSESIHCDRTNVLTQIIEKNSAAVCGQVFASPNANQVSAALERLTSGGAKGILVITKQYTGDVIQFGLATEKFSAAHVGKDIARMIVVGN